MTEAEATQLRLIVTSLESAIHRDRHERKPGQGWAVHETVEASLPVLRLLLREAGCEGNEPARAANAAD